MKNETHINNMIEELEKIRHKLDKLGEYKTAQFIEGKIIALHWVLDCA